LKTGDGAEVADGQPVILDVGIFDGVTGKAVVTAAQGGMIAASASGSQLPGLQKALLCTPVGSRIAVTGTVSQVLGSEAQLNIPASSTVIAVATVSKAFLARADGTPRPAQPGMPTVVLAPNGQPGIKIPAHDAPKSLTTAVLKQGSGETVKKGQYTVVNYTAVAWSSPDVVASSSWENGGPLVWPTSDGSVPTDVSNKLIGQKVGSQLIVVTPGSGAKAYVIDILGIAR
jgi:peptidylprolyl isomerase